MVCSTKVLKVLALFWDTIYSILGAVVVGIGIYISLKFDAFQTPAILIITLGVVLLLNAAFGCFAAVRESSRLSKVFAAILVILAILLLVVVGFLWAFQTPILIDFDNNFDKLWREQPVPRKPSNVTKMASLERWLDCCGSAGPTDYILPPYSCYNKNDKLNLDGCRQKFLDYLADRWTALNIFVLILLAVEMICAVLAYVLANSIMNRWRRSKYYPK